jgi:hypothetical protein
MILKEVQQDIVARGIVLSESTEEQDLKEKANSKWKIEHHHHNHKTRLTTAAFPSLKSTTPCRCPTASKQVTYPLATLRYQPSTYPIRPSTSAPTPNPDAPETSHAPLQDSACGLAPRIYPPTNKQHPSCQPSTSPLGDPEYHRLASISTDHHKILRTVTHAHAAI